MSKKYLIFTAVAVFFLVNAGFVYADQLSHINNIIPVSVIAGHNAFTLYVNGTHFKSESVIYFGSLALDTTRFSSQQLQHSFPAASLSSGIYYISVTDQEGTSNAVEFKVYNAPPTADNLAVSSNSCPVAESTGLAIFSWNYQDLDDDHEEQFQLQIDNNADFSSPAVDRNYIGLSNPPGTQNQQAVSIVVNGDEVDSLKYNTSYYWRVKVCQVDVDPALVGPGGICSAWTSGVNYTTISHPGPYVTFSISDTSPGVTFTNNSICYNTSGSEGCASYLYDFGDDITFIVSNPTQGISNTTHTYSELITYDVSVVVTDASSLQCQAIQQVSITNQTASDLPFWKEISPFQFSSPSQCVANGGYCPMGLGSLCCSGWCVTEICTPVCSEPLTVCTTNEECCSGSCVSTEFGNYCAA